MNKDKKYKMGVTIAKEGEEFTIPSEAQHEKIEYVEVGDSCGARRLVKVWYLVPKGWADEA